MHPGPVDPQNAACDLKQTTSFGKLIPAVHLNPVMICSNIDEGAAKENLSAEALELIHQQCGWSFDTFNYPRRSVSSLS